MAGEGARVTIAATLIVRNEAAMLPDCLRSLQGRVDEIIIIDALSDDGSDSIAREFGAKVISRKWTGNFADARNAALDAHRCDYSLYIDADERLGLPDGGHLGDYLYPNERFMLVRFQPRIGFTRYAEWRIFRNDPAIRFEGNIHETVVPAARRLDAHPRHTTVEIDHIGYEGSMVAKWRRNRPLLEQAVRIDPDRAYLWFDLAECLLGLGDIDDARSTIERGLAAAARKRSRDQDAARSLLLNLKAAMLTGNTEACFEVLHEGLEFRGDDHGLRFLLGQAYLDAGLPDEALSIARHMRCIDPDTLFEGPMAYDRRIFLDAAVEMEALALLALGRQAEAASAFARAAALAPDNPVHRLRGAALTPSNRREQIRVH